MKARALLLLLALLGVVLAGCGGEALPDDAAGSDVYAANCTGCHRADLSGGVGPALGTGAPSTGEPRDYFISVITNGRSGMPAFGSRLSGDQIEAVVDFILDRQGR